MAPWYEDTVKKEEEAKKHAYRTWIAEELQKQLGIEIHELKPMQIERVGIIDNRYVKRWTPAKEPSRTTNDGCEHYVHVTTGAHYKMCYRSQGCQWYAEPTTQPV